MLLVDKGSLFRNHRWCGEPLRPLAVAVWFQLGLRQLHNLGVPPALRSLCATPGLCSEMLKLVLPGQGWGCLLESPPPYTAPTQSSRKRSM